MKKQLKYHNVDDDPELDYKDGFNDCRDQIKQSIEGRYE